MANFFGTVYKDFNYNDDVDTHVVPINEAISFTGTIAAQGGRGVYNDTNIIIGPYNTIMYLYDYNYASSSANLAKERLKVIVSHERAKNKDPEFLKKLHAEIMEVIKKYVNIESNNVNVNIDQDSDCSVLELNVTVNDSTQIKDKQPA